MLKRSRPTRFMERKLLISGIPWEKAFTILCISVSFPSCWKELIHIAKRFSHKSWLQCNIAFRKECQLQNVRTGLASIQISIIFTQLISCIRFHNIFCYSTGRASSVYWQPSVQPTEPLLERPFACCRFRDSCAVPSKHPLPHASIPSLYHSQKAGVAIVRPPSPATYSVNSFDSVPVGSSVDNLLIYSLLLHSFLPVSQQKGLPVSLFPTYGIPQWNLFRYQFHSSLQLL